MIKKGVTLIELLVVVLILAALAAVAVPRLAPTSITAQERINAANLDMINQTLEHYYHSTGDWPSGYESAVSALEAEYFPDGFPEAKAGKSWAYDTDKKKFYVSE